MKKALQLTLAKTVGLYINVLSYVAPDKSLQLAYKLFSEPRKGRYTRPSLPKTLEKAHREQLTYKEHVIQVYSWKGNEDIVFLLHGWESNASRWKKLLRHLIKTGKTIIAIDAPAHGQSTGKEFNVPTYAEFVNQVALKYPPNYIIGHSVGGNAAVYYQKHYNHNLEKMVLLGAPSDMKVILGNFISILGLNNKVHAQLKTYTQERFNIAIEDFSAAIFLQNCSIDGIIAHDEDDDVVRIDESEKLSKAWPKAHFIKTKGKGHSLHDDNLYEKICSFIA